MKYVKRKERQVLVSGRWLAQRDIDRKVWLPEFRRWYSVREAEARLR